MQNIRSMVSLIPTRTKQHPTSQQAHSSEYHLVLYMLLALVVLVICILWIPINASNATDMLEFRRATLTVIVTAFSAWIGAGAAYFFGKENLRVATQSILQASAPPKERLAQTKVMVRARPLDWKVKMDTTVGDIVSQIKAEDQPKWFFPVIKDDGTLATVIKDDSVWLFIALEAQAGKAYADIINETVQDILNKVKYSPIHVTVRADQTMEDADKLMDEQDCYLTIILDEKNIPRFYLTTGDVRRFLLK